MQFHDPVSKLDIDFCGISNALAIRNTALLMITMTMILYHLLLAASQSPQGLHAVSNILQHYITPIVTIIVWLLVGPRGRYTFSDVNAPEDYIVAIYSSPTSQTVLDVILVTSIPCVDTTVGVLIGA